MMPSPRFVLLSLACLVACCACGGDGAHCAVCGREECRNLAFTIHTEDGRGIETCCPRCALHYLHEQRPAVARLEVRDFATAAALDARSAAYVEGSEVHPCSTGHDMPRDEHGCCLKPAYDRCLPSLLAFADAASAERFAREHGGFVTSFERLEQGRRLGGLRAIDTPAAPGSSAPNLAAAAAGQLYLSWIEPAAAGHALRFARWSEGRWSEARTVAAGADWFVNWADFPSLAALADGTLAAHWLVRSGESRYAYDVHLSLSHDGGQSWSAPLRPHRDGTQAEHGFVSLAAQSPDQFGVLWLDGRNATATPPGPTALRYTVLQRDGRLGEEIEVDGSVCDCCSTDAVVAADGTILAAYRDRSTEEIRDIAVARQEGRAQWSTPATVHADQWRIAACPVNGPALARDGSAVVVAWFTAAAEPAVHAAFSHDGGRSFGAPLRLDHGEPLGRVDVILLDDTTAIVSWLEHDASGASIMLRQVAPAGALQSVQVATTSEARASGFPRMARTGDEIVLAWTEPGEPSRIATAVSRVPAR